MRFYRFFQKIFFGRSGLGRHRHDSSKLAEQERNGQAALMKIDVTETIEENDKSHTTRDKSAVSSNRTESQVGSAMRELTSQRVAVGILIMLIINVILTPEYYPNYVEPMFMLHMQTTSMPEYREVAVELTRNSTLQKLYSYTFSDDTMATEYMVEDISIDDLRPRDSVEIIIRSEDFSGTSIETSGLIDIRHEVKISAAVELLATIFILAVWFFGVMAFAGPVMTLVVIPIERMIQLLGMLMKDPLGYQSTKWFKNFKKEEDNLAINTSWTVDVLKGMETSYLMKTILRIGSLMRVGFGSAGVEIIRNNLERQRKKDILLSTSGGSTVRCIFLFCDIRQFTDATECLQEEVFVFTNKIASVVHSISSGYGGSANKNIGDAFLLSWLLKDETSVVRGSASRPSVLFKKSADTSSAANSHKPIHHCQADKALYAVVRINMALHHEKFFLNTLSKAGRTRLLTKFEKRDGPIVQMGFGLHAGKAVQGAIGTQRKIDATYVSEAVEMAETLESSTKTYGLSVMMSEDFYAKLSTENRRRCREVDIIRQDDEEHEDENVNVGSIYTFDMDIDALWAFPTKSNSGLGESDGSTHGARRPSSSSSMFSKRSSRRSSVIGVVQKALLSSSLSTGADNETLDDVSVTPSIKGINIESMPEFSSEFPNNNRVALYSTDLPKPNTTLMYRESLWQNDVIKRLRKKFERSSFFLTYKKGLAKYYERDWNYARDCFSTILETIDDGPSKYFLKKIDEHNGVPPPDFVGYNTLK
eukprot:CAMPEP_0178951726 /NCGR_PEP_ID=MMETSP0789-20121207/7392_1 /TAXON_ID=3005 /ORGANISM="Rhizosolenia setigera, Strain CCMP 1694" /LENGTH=760 /DNA_ID=CAMNT_0020632643 /DNA_START=606 /DNA_END=2888 /DNA_ORIENTATION=+